MWRVRVRRGTMPVGMHDPCGSLHPCAANSKNTCINTFVARRVAAAERAADEMGHAGRAGHRQAYGNDFMHDFEPAGTNKNGGFIGHLPRPYVGQAHLRGQQDGVRVLRRLGQARATRQPKSLVVDSRGPPTATAISRSASAPRSRRAPTEGINLNLPIAAGWLAALLSRRTHRATARARHLLALLVALLARLVAFGAQPRALGLLGRQRGLQLRRAHAEQAPSRSARSRASSAACCAAIACRSRPLHRSAAAVCVASSSATTAPSSSGRARPARWRRRADGGAPARELLRRRRARACSAARAASISPAIGVRSARARRASASAARALASPAAAPAAAARARSRRARPPRRAPPRTPSTAPPPPTRAADLRQLLGRLERAQALGVRRRGRPPCSSPATRAVAASSARSCSSAARIAGRSDDGSVSSRPAPPSPAAKSPPARRRRARPSAPARRSGGRRRRPRRPGAGTPSPYGSVSTGVGRCRRSASSSTAASPPSVKAASMLKFSRRDQNFSDWRKTCAGSAHFAARAQRCPSTRSSRTSASTSTTMSLTPLTAKRRASTRCLRACARRRASARRGALPGPEQPHVAAGGPGRAREACVCVCSTSATTR